MGNPNGLESESGAVAYLKIPGDTVDGIDFGTVTQDRQEGKIRC